MAKARRKPKSVAKRQRGPFLAAAFFCESIIEGKDNALTPVRMIDQLQVMLGASTPPDVPSEVNRVSVGVWSVICLKTGGSPGDYALEIIAESPSGKKEAVFEQTITLTEPAQGGVNIKLHHNIGVKKGGLFWMHVSLDDRPLTSMPLLITVVREKAAPPEADGEPGSDGAAKLRKRRRP